VERARWGRSERPGAGLNKSVGEAREKLGRNALTSFLIVDAQSVKNTDGVMERLNAAVQIVKRNELHTFAVLPKRWIVERSFAWLEKCRRLW
jgi:hypothetical protein